MTHYDEDGNERSLNWMMKNRPGWVRSRMAFYEDNYRPKDWDKWITPEKYKEITGEDWPDDGPVWWKYKDGHPYGNEFWTLSDYYPYRDTTFNLYYIIIANQYGKPPADFIPEE